MKLKWALLLPSLVLSTGCDRLDSRIPGLFDWESSVLAREPFVLGPQGRVFSGNGQVRSRGDASVCVVLRKDYPLQHQPRMDRDFASLVHGARMTVEVTDQTGRVHAFEGVNQTWSQYGEVSTGPELSACAHAPRGELPDGTVIRTIQLKSDTPLPVQGAWWHTQPGDGSSP